jgi:hypothetical protein
MMTYEEHTYDLRWNYFEPVGSRGGGLSRYTDDVQQVLDAIARGGVAFIADGYADYEDTDDGTDRWMVTRRTVRSYTPDQFVIAFGPIDWPEAV